MRVLITGAQGFVGPHLIAALREEFATRLTLAVSGLRAARAHSEEIQLDVTEVDVVRSILSQFQPTHIINLAGVTAPSVAAADPALAWRVNVNGVRILAEAVLSEAPHCWLINIVSGLVYGAQAQHYARLGEAVPMAPLDIYAATKSAADELLSVYAGRGLRCLRMRPFNHTGPGQEPSFVVAAFAKRIADIEHGTSPPIMKVGNLDIERDFLDVRDVAAAYVLAIARSDNLTSGSVFNIASGAPRRVSNVLDMMLARSPIEILVERDPSLQRAGDISRIVGDAENARKLLEWAPRIPFETTVGDVLDDWRVRRSPSRPA